MRLGYTLSDVDDIRYGRLGRFLSSLTVALLMVHGHVPMASGQCACVQWRIW